MTRIFFVAVVGLLALAACTSSASDGADPSVDGDTALALPADFQFTAYQGEGELGGQELQFSEILAQGKPIVLNFWAGLCPPCRLEMPDLQAVHDARQDEIILVGVDVGPFTALGSRDDGQALLAELGITYPAGTIFDAQVVRAYEIIGMPSTYFIKPNGEVARKWTGLLTEEKLNELVEELLAASNSS